MSAFEPKADISGQDGPRTTATNCHNDSTYEEESRSQDEGSNENEASQCRSSCGWSRTFPFHPAGSGWAMVAFDLKYIQ